MTNTDCKEPSATCIACGKELPDFKAEPRRRPTCDNKECRRVAYHTPARRTVTIEEGEVICAQEGCGQPVPAGDYDISKTLFFCSRACRNKYRRSPHEAAAPRKRTVEEGEIICAREGCGRPVPAGEYDLSKTQFFCSGSCRSKHHAAKGRANKTPLPRKRTVEEGEIICAREGCGRPVPAGDYDIKKRLFFCGRGCARRYYAANYVVGQCRHCGGDIHDYPFMTGKREFCCGEHKNMYFGQQRLERETGPFAATLTRYLETYGRSHYSADALKTRRLELIALLGFVHQLGIADLERVTPSVISQFVAREVSRGVQHRNFVSGASTFFSWMLVEGLRRNPNPVIPRIHITPGPEHGPRPYSDAELDERWNIVEKFGTPLERIAFSIGIESGVRGGELRRIREGDVDETAQSIQVRLPTKNRTPRKTLYHDRAKRYLAEWKQHRDPYCGHDYLLHNQHSRPITNTGYIQTLIKTTLAEHGVTEFSFHRLRHTWATRLHEAGVDLATIMALGGWRSLEGVKRYLGLSQRRIEESYFEAMAKARKDRELADEQVVSLADFAFADEEPKANAA